MGVGSASRSRRRGHLSSRRSVRCRRSVRVNGSSGRWPVSSVPRSAAPGWPCARLAGSDVVLPSSLHFVRPLDS
eukprot:63139-Prymnesium_polylepis.2